MGGSAVAEKPEAEEKDGAEKKPLWWGVAAGTVILSLAVGYRIVTGSGDVNIQTNGDGIQVKITEAQKTIESAQEELRSAQQQLKDRESALGKREQALNEREAKVQELIASLDKTTPSPSPHPLTPQQAQAELKKLRASPPVAAAAPMPVEATPVKSRLEKLEQLRSVLVKTNTELNAAKAPAAAN
jgi:DNA repair exonuclease SbcCD ATPase subunit